MIHRSLFATALAVALTGCVIHIPVGDDHQDDHMDVHERAAEHREAIARMQLGASWQSVIDRLGAPDFSDTMRAPQGELRVLRYRTHRTEADGATTRDETTPLVFIDGELVGSGEEALSIELMKIGHSTPDAKTEAQ